MTLLLSCLKPSSKWFFCKRRRRLKNEKQQFYLMFRSGIDLRGKTHILKVGLLASLALLRCQRSLNSLVKCSTSRQLVNCLWTHQKSTCLHINEAPCTWQGSSSHTYLFPWKASTIFLETTEQRCFSILGWCLFIFTNSPDHPKVRAESLKQWRDLDLPNNTYR